MSPRRHLPRLLTVSALVAGCSLAPRAAAPPAASDCAVAPVLHRDADGDGLGDPYTTSRTCPAPAGWVEDATDCDDADPAIGPARPWHRDADGDGYGAIAAVTACDAPPDAVDDASDCDDAHAEAHPGGREICADGLDGDCDGSPSPCRYDGDVSLSRALQFTGVHEYGEVGMRVAGLGDTDGDGLDDVIVGAPGETVGGIASAGRVYLLTDAPTGSRALEGADVWLAGDADGDVGPGVDWTGDVDGNGLADGLVRASDPVYMFSGLKRSPPGAVSIALARLPDGVKRAGGVGDLDQDGFDDVIGTDVIDWTGGFAGGAAFVFAGPLDGELAKEDAAYTFYGSEGMLVYQPSRAGDLDGDGRVDVALGGGTAMFVDFLSGAVYVVTEPVPGVQSLADADAILYGVAREEQAGNDLDGAGDVNGDGYGDLIVGSTTYHSEGGAYYEQRVAATLVYGPISGELRLDEVGHRFTCAYYSDCASAAVSGAGDMDRDGFDDFVIGSPLGVDPSGYVTGAAWLFYGPVAAGGDLDVTADAKLYAEGHDYVGWDVDGAGDVDGDGFADLVLGAPSYSGDALVQGAAYVVLGGAL